MIIPHNSDTSNPELNIQESLQVKAKEGLSIDTSSYLYDTNY